MSASHYPPGASRALEEQARDEEAYEAWERMAESSDALEELTNIVATAAWEALNWPDDGDGVGHHPASVLDLKKLIGPWLNGQRWLYDWEAAHGLIPTFELWRERHERDVDTEYHARIENGRAR